MMLFFFLVFFKIIILKCNSHIYIYIHVCCLNYRNETDIQPSVDQSSNFKCPKCTKSFIRKNELNVHIAAKHEKKSFTCPKCQKVFAYKTNAKRHENKCNGTKQSSKENENKCNGTKQPSKEKPVSLKKKIAL